MLQPPQVPRQWSALLQAHVHAEGLLQPSVLPLPLICSPIPEAPESSQDPGHQVGLKGQGRVVWDSQGSQLPGRRMGRSMGALPQGVFGPRLFINNQVLPHWAFLLPRQALTRYFNSPGDTEHPPVLCCQPSLLFFSDELLGDGLCSCAVPDWWVGLLGAVRSLLVGWASSGLCLVGQAGGAEVKGEDSCPVWCGGRTGWG